MAPTVHRGFNGTLTCSPEGPVHSRTQYLDGAGAHLQLPPLVERRLSSSHSKATVA